jgi:hypothetical protein
LYRENRLLLPFRKTLLGIYFARLAAIEDMDKGSFVHCSIKAPASSKKGL